MGLKAGWLGLFLFVWLIGIFLGSTFDFYNTAASAGQASTGNATFTTGSRTVIGAGTAWVAGMANGVIKCNADNVWYKISSVTNPTTLVLSGAYNEAGGPVLPYTMTTSAGWAGSGTGGYAKTPITKLQAMIGMWEAHQELPLLGRLVLIVTNGDFWSTAWDIVTWQWSFMEDYTMLWLIMCMPFVVMGILSMILLVYGIISGNITWG